MFLIIGDNMNNKITINIDGKEQEVYFITVITLDKYKSSYLVYSLSELKDNFNILEIAKLVDEEGKVYLSNLSGEEEYDVKRSLGEELGKYE